MPSFLLSKLARSFFPMHTRLVSDVAKPLLLSPKSLSDLQTHSSSEHISILDASWVMPNSGRNPKDEFTAKRIPGAQFLDLDEVASPHHLGLKHMMPQEHMFADACGRHFILAQIHFIHAILEPLERFGIGPDSHVVMYAFL
jgi:thiosulfate/3-mercaptopyruvate sulfurtransferase